MTFFNKEVELIIPPKKYNNSVKGKSLNGYDAIREKVDEDNTRKINPAPIPNPRKDVKIQVL